MTIKSVYLLKQHTLGNHGAISLLKQHTLGNHGVFIRRAFTNILADQPPHFSGIRRADKGSLLDLIWPVALALRILVGLTGQLLLVHLLRAPRVFCASLLGHYVMCCKTLAT